MVVLQVLSCKLVSYGHLLSLCLPGFWRLVVVRSRVGGRVAKPNGLYSGNDFRHLWNLAHNLGTSGLPEVIEMFRCWTVVMVAQLDEFTKNL